MGFISFPGVGRDKKNPVTFVVNSLGTGAGGDYHATCYPQATFISSRLVQGHLKVISRSRLDNSLGIGTGGDFHTMYYPQATFISSMLVQGQGHLTVISRSFRGGG